MKDGILILGVALVIFMGSLPQADAAKGGKGKPEPEQCARIPADATFRDHTTDGIQSDIGLTYQGNLDSQVQLLRDKDHDFVLVTDPNFRQVTLDFDANNDTTNLPFLPDQMVDVLIRVDEVTLVPECVGQAVPKDVNDLTAGCLTRFLMWFGVGRERYRLVFDGEQTPDGMAQAGKVLVKGTGTEPARQWTIESDGPARLEEAKGRQLFIGLFTMPFRITVDERPERDPTCQ